MLKFVPSIATWVQCRFSFSVRVCVQRAQNVKVPLIWYECVLSHLRIKFVSTFGSSLMHRSARYDVVAVVTFVAIVLDDMLNRSGYDDTICRFNVRTNGRNEINNKLKLWNGMNSMPILNYLLHSTYEATQVSILIDGCFAQFFIE